MILKKNDARVKKIRDIYQKNGAKGMLLSMSHNTSWLLGCRTHVGLAGSTGICEVLVCESGVYLIANNIESERLMSEEVCSDEVIAKTYRWDRPEERDKILKELCPCGILYEKDYETELLKARTVLLPDQIEEMKSNCALAGQIMEYLCLSVKQGMTERQIVGSMASNVYEAGMEPIVLLAASDQRLMKYRHPICSDQKVGKYLMLSMGCRKDGMYVSITRTISFGCVEEKMRRAQEAVNLIAATLYEKTRPGRYCKDLYKEIDEMYKETGYGEQIGLHHQGGLGGFQAREDKVTPNSNIYVQAGQAFAWNPSVIGYKNEDMLLIGEERNEIMTITKNLNYEKVTVASSVWNIPQIIER